MKRFAFVTSLLVAVLSFSVIAKADETATAEKPWFNLENCAMCKNLKAEEGLLDNMKWEHYLIGTGMMTVTQVAKGYEEKYTSATKHMQETSQALMQGEKLQMCGMCESMGALFGTGEVIWESIETETAEISLMTSTDDDAIAKIKEHARRTIDEYKKWKAAQTN